MGGIEGSDIFALLSTGDEQLRVKNNENQGVAQDLPGS